MNCFLHQQTPAVGLCKHCSRGLCPECAHDEGYGLACKNRCEEEVKAVTLLIEKNKGVLGRTSAVYLRGALLYGLMGLFFLIFPYLFLSTPVELIYLFNGMGVLLLFGMVINLINARRIKKS